MYHMYVCMRVRAYSMYTVPFNCRHTEKARVLILQPINNEIQARWSINLRHLQSVLSTDPSTSRTLCVHAAILVGKMNGNTNSDGHCV